MSQGRNYSDFIFLFLKRRIIGRSRRALKREDMASQATMGYGPRAGGSRAERMAAAGREGGRGASFWRKPSQKAVMHFGTENSIQEGCGPTCLLSHKSLWADISMGGNKLINGQTQKSTLG